MGPLVVMVLLENLLINLTANTDYVLSLKVKATEGKTYNKGASML